MAKITIPKSALIRLYYKQKKSKYEIGKIYNCSFKTVLNRMREFEMKPLSRSIIQSKYEKKDFSGKNEEKAYLIGFRLGDLNVYQTASHSDVIVVRCHTTRKEQLDMIKKLFKQYGKVTIGGKNKMNSKYINCFLNKSFSFLLPNEDKIEKWITKNSSCSNYFAAGYIDAEGNIGIYDKRARFKVDSYDKNIILWLYKWLQKNNILCPAPTKIGKAGQIYDNRNKYKYNKDLWRIRVSNMESLNKLFQILKPILKHRKRLLDLKKCIKNINNRNAK